MTDHHGVEQRTTVYTAAFTTACGWQTMAKLSSRKDLAIRQSRYTVRQRFQLPLASGAVGVARLVIVSDTHLSERVPEAADNFAAIAGYVRRSRADLIVHAGDLTLDGATAPAELGYARALLDTLPSPWVAVPGNHDVGDTPGVSGLADITADGLQAWRDAIGADRWVVEMAAWTVIGVNAQLFGSNLPESDVQWKWLADQLHNLAAQTPVLLVSHKPLTAPKDEMAAAPAYRFVPASARDRLNALLAGVRVPIVVSGHVHQYRLLDEGGRRHVWAPTSWAVLPDSAQATFGLKRCGAVSVTLDADNAIVEMVEPPGIRQLTVTVDVSDPYGH